MMKKKSGKNADKVDKSINLSHIDDICRCGNEFLTLGWREETVAKEFELQSEWSFSSFDINIER